jgi:hypothetical protein
MRLRLLFADWSETGRRSDVILFWLEHPSKRNIRRLHVKNPKDNCQYIVCTVCTSSVSPQHNWSLSNSIHNKWATNRWSFLLMATQFHQHQLPAPRQQLLHITNIFIYCYIHMTAMVCVSVCVCVVQLHLVLHFLIPTQLPQFKIQFSG